jgi:hypothetical protein
VTGERTLKWTGAVLASHEPWRAILPPRSLEKRDRRYHHGNFQGLIDEARDVLERGYRINPSTEVWTRAYATFPEQAVLHLTAGQRPRAMYCPETPQ